MTSAGSRSQQTLVLAAFCIGRSFSFGAQRRFVGFGHVPRTAARTNHQRRVGAKLLPEALHARQFGRPASMQQLCHLLAGQAARAQPGAPELARDEVTPSVQAAAECGRHCLGILGVLYVGASAHETS